VETKKWESDSSLKQQLEDKKWESDSSLKQQLEDEYYRFTFFRAVNLIEHFFGINKKKIGETLNPSEECIKFSVKPGLNFCPSEIADIIIREDGSVKLFLNIMGLIGPTGVLPGWYNELALNQKKGFTDFLDIFHHRIISLFYLAWKKKRLGPENKKASHYFNCLLGLGTNGLINSLGLPQKNFLPFCSGLLSRYVPSANVLKLILENFSGFKINIKQFVEQMLPISEEDQTLLGENNSYLDGNMICGNVVLDNQSKFIIEIGPLKYKDFKKLLPTENLHMAVLSLIKYFVGPEYEFDLCLILSREETPIFEIPLDDHDAPKLGWTTWLDVPDVDPCLTFKEYDSYN